MKFFFRIRNSNAPNISFARWDMAYLFVRRDSVAVNLDVYLSKSETRQDKKKIEKKKKIPSITKHIHQFSVYSFSSDCAAFSHSHIHRNETNRSLFIAKSLSSNFSNYEPWFSYFSIRFDSNYLLISIRTVFGEHTHTHIQTQKFEMRENIGTRFPNMYYRFTFRKPQIGEFNGIPIRIFAHHDFIRNIRFLCVQLCSMFAFGMICVLEFASVITNQKWKPENRINVADIVILFNFTTKCPFLNAFIRILFPIWFECMKFSREPNWIWCRNSKFGVPFQVFVCCCCDCSLVTCNEMWSQMYNMDFGLTLSEWTKQLFQFRIRSLSILIEKMWKLFMAWLTNGIWWITLQANQVIYGNDRTSTKSHSKS